MSLEWYSVKGLFRWYFKDSGETERIEERIVLLRADSFDHALDLAEEEAQKYCTEDSEANFRIEPVSWWHAYWIGNEPFDGVEIFSRSCLTKLEGEAFVRRYYPKTHNATANPSCHRTCTKSHTGH